MEKLNQVSYKVTAPYALFTDPFSKTGGDKCSYHIPTYEAMVGITKSIYWKPTFIWVIDKVRVMNPIRTESKNIKPIKMNDGGNTLAIYNYLANVEYQVLAHFEWNMNRPEFDDDRIDGKHFTIAQRMIEKGGRRDIFLGTRECQGYVEPCQFGETEGAYDNAGELAYGVMFHGFDYPDETGVDKFEKRFWRPKMVNGVIDFLPPNQCDETMKVFIREMKPGKLKTSGLNEESLRYELD